MNDVKITNIINSVKKQQIRNSFCNSFCNSLYLLLVITMAIIIGINIGIIARIILNQIDKIYYAKYPMIEGFYFHRQNTITTKLFENITKMFDELVNI